MMDKGGDAGGQAANNSSDFVRKLYKMLEDPTYEKIVKWGEGGESFVVLENDKFTKHILPKHFKHSNFASFVRQLNKYDFHKVRQTNEDTTPSPYGPNAWEFKHPEFQANRKDALDNIRRKAPAPRKVLQGVDEQAPSPQMDMVNSQLVVTQQQMQHLSDRYQELASCNALLLDQVFQLQKFIKNHDGVMHRVVGFLQSLEAERRNNRFPNGSAAASPSALHPVSPLQKASALLDELSAETLPNKELEHMSQELRARNDYPTPTAETAGSAPLRAHFESSTSNIGLVGSDLDSMVYPVGQTNGIDPINSDHINNIPYALPASALLNIDPLPHMPRSASVSQRRKTSGPVWGPTRGRVLLVEDDLLCARIGYKFLASYECDCIHAVNGMDAVTKINASPDLFHLILMDIIMPHLDGVSATVLIRETRPDIPVIAMTSNIRADDIDVYFKHGMNDVLAKPFTKENMFKVLSKHLPPHVSKPDESGSNSQPRPPPPLSMSQRSNLVTPSHSQAPLHLNMASLSAPMNVKEEPSPIRKSPATATSWHSPAQMPGASPIGPLRGSYAQPMRDNSLFKIATPLMHTHSPGSFPSSEPAPCRTESLRRGLGDMSGTETADDQPEKRQRMYTGALPH